MLYCFMFFQSVLDPIAHDYSQVQNCMHKQLQQQFTDCELNQPIVSTISCSLLIWKELGRWLPLQLASCGQLGLLVQSCTDRQAMCKSDACQEPHTFDSSYLTRYPPTILCIARGCKLEKIWNDQSDLYNAIGTEDTNLSMSWCRREGDMALIWVENK